MKSRLIWVFTALLFLAISAHGATVIITCDVGGAQLEIYDDSTRSFKPSSFPKVMNVPRYTYFIVRVTAPGYEVFESGYEVNRADVNNFLISLKPEISNPATVPLFGMCGQIISRRGLIILPGTYRVIFRNLTTFKKNHAHQVSQDINPSETNGGFSGVFANLATNRAAAAGDRVFIGVFNNSLTRCYGHKVFTLTEEEISNAGMFTQIFIR